MLVWIEVQADSQNMTECSYITLSYLAYGGDGLQEYLLDRIEFWTMRWKSAKGCNDDFNL